MFNPIKLYRKSQEVQYNWIRNHPVQYVALNAIVGMACYGYLKYEGRQWEKAYMHIENNKLPQQEK